MLLLTNHAHNKEVRASKRRDWRRGCSEATVDRVFANEDAVRRLLCEFESLDEVGTLRRCNMGLWFMVYGLEFRKTDRQMEREIIINDTPQRVVHGRRPGAPLVRYNAPPMETRIGDGDQLNPTKPQTPNPKP